MPWVSIRTDQVPNFSDSDREKNVTMIWNNLGSKGFTANAVGAICSNMLHEGFLNPGQYQLGSNYSLYFPWGSGLCGWTPTYKNPNDPTETYNPMQLLGSWCDSQGLDHENGDAQLAYLNYEMTDWDGHERLTENAYAPNLGYPRQPPLTALEFISSELEPDTLGAYWAIYYEHPGESNLRDTLNVRMSDSITWYNFILGLGPPTPPEPPTPTRKKKMPIWMMCRRNYF